MALTDSDKIIAIIIVAIIAAIVIYLELRLRKLGVGKKYASSRVKKDQAFNSLHTTKAVRNKLKMDRISTLKADYMIQRAEDSLDSGDYESCNDLCRQAREELLKGKREGNVVAAGLSLSGEEGAGEKTASSKVNESVRAASAGISNSAKLQANFELRAAQDDLDKFSGDGKARERASEYVDEAERQFESGEYQKSLSWSFKARKVMSGEDVEDKPEPPTPSAKIADEELKCKSCGAPNEPEDAFCHSCGRSLKLVKCANCGAELKGFEKFCRKCGKSVQ